MRLVLASQGFLTDDIANAVSSLVNKQLEEINVAVINEGYVAIAGDHDKRWMINELSRISKYIGGRIDFVNLRACDRNEIKARLSQADLIYIVGGKQFILPDLFKQTGTDEILKELSKEIVIMGTSAGANVLGRQVESNEYWEKRYGITNESITNKQLGLVNFNIIPHYLRKDRKEWDNEFYISTLKDNPFPLYAIIDTQAVIYDNGNIFFVGGDPEIFGKNDESGIC